MASEKKKDLAAEEKAARPTQLRQAKEGANENESAGRYEHDILVRKQNVRPEHDSRPYLPRHGPESEYHDVVTIHRAQPADRPFPKEPQAEANKNLIDGNQGRGSKAMDTMTKPEDGGPTGGAVLPEEPFGAQLIRRCHKDRMHLLEEYHTYLEHVEDPGVRKLVEKLLGNMDGEMSALEDFFSSHDRYKELPPLEGGMQNEQNEENEEVEEEAPKENEPMEGEEEETASAEEEEPESEALEEPTGDEAVEGMSQSQDEIEEQRGEKSLPSDKMEMSPEKAKKILKDGTVHGHKLTKKQRGLFGAIAGGKKSMTLEQAKALEFYRRAKGVCPKCGEDPCTCANKTHTDTGYDSGEIGSKDELLAEESGGHKPGDEAYTQEQHMPFQPHHQKPIEDGVSFLRHLSTSPELTRDDSLNAYHHHRNYQGIVDEMGNTGEKAGLKIEANATPEEIAQGAAMMASMDVPNVKGGFPEIDEADAAMEINKGKKGTSFPEMCSAADGVEVTVGKGKKKDMGVEQGHEPGGEALQEIQHEPKHPYHEKMEEASRFFKEISGLHPTNFSNEHRGRAMHHHEELNTILHAFEQGFGLPKGPEDVKLEVGETGAKAVKQDSLTVSRKSLNDVVAQSLQDNEETMKAMKELNEKLIAMYGVFNKSSSSVN